MASGFAPMPGSFRDSRDLGPLQQRLFLYGFAWVQVDPLAEHTTAGLGISGLQLLATGPEARAWRRLFPDAGAFSEHTSYAVISPSLTALKQLRQRMPRRPLIYVQTAYESPPGPRALAALFGERPRLARRLHPSDPFRCLSLFRKVTMSCVPELHPAWQQFPRHPLADFMDHAVRADPHSSFWAQEDGLVLQQKSLFGHGRRPPDFLARTLPHYDRLFLDFMNEIPEGAYIMASEQEHLDWFRADCVRLLSKKYCCWHWPEQSDPADPCIPLVLVSDTDIAFASLDRSLPLVHLNGSERSFRYRALRKRKPRPPVWRPDRNGDSIAHYTCLGYRLTFSHHEQGWFCADGQTSGTDGQQHFARYLDTLEGMGV